MPPPTPHISSYAYNLKNTCKDRTAFTSSDRDNGLFPTESKSRNLKEMKKKYQKYNDLAFRPIKHCNKV